MWTFNDHVLMWRLLRCIYLLCLLRVGMVEDFSVGRSGSNACCRSPRVYCSLVLIHWGQVKSLAARASGLLGQGSNAASGLSVWPVLFNRKRSEPGYIARTVVACKQGGRMRVRGPRVEVQCRCTRGTARLAIIYIPRGQGRKCCTFLVSKLSENSSVLTVRACIGASVMNSCRPHLVVLLCHLSSEKNGHRRYHAKSSQ